MPGTTDGMIQPGKVGGAAEWWNPQNVPRTLRSSFHLLLSGNLERP